MKTKRMKWLSSIALLAGLTVVLAACGGSKGNSTDGSGNGKKSSGEVTISFFDKNSGTKKFDDRIAKEIEKRTGVKINLQNPTGDAGTKSALMLSSRDYPDIVMLDRNSDLLSKYIDAKAFIPLDDYIEKNPVIKEMYGDVLNRTRAKDGKNYYLSNFYGKSDQPVNAFLMRYDWMVELLGKERADSSQPFTQAEFIQLLKDFQAKHPEVDGKKAIPFTIPQSILGSEGMYGIKTFWNDGGKIKDTVENPNWFKYVSFLNTLQREGLLDPEWVNNKEEVVNQKLATGNVFGIATSYWVPQSANDAARAAGKPDSVYVSYKVLGDGIGEKETTYAGRSTLGWDAIGITDNAKDVDAAMKLVSFLVSREGQSLMLWGIEGEDYTVENGEYVPTKATLDAFVKDRDKAINELGISRWTWFISNQGPTENTPPRLVDYIDKETFDSKMAYKNMTDTSWDFSEFDQIQPAGSTPEGLAYQKISDIKNQSTPKQIFAGSEAELKSLYDQMLADMKNAGVENVEKVLTENYKARQDLAK